VRKKGSRLLSNGHHVILLWGHGEKSGCVSMSGILWELHKKLLVVLTDSRGWGDTQWHIPLNDLNFVNYVHVTLL
jgi:hypothetical protein